ncbi:MAG TPA: hypothetical protein VE864_02460, partial [Streptosporangiaceae bacterium]|nr:hypothetical protein [Streptosporangiaceae bacterium]
EGSQLGEELDGQLRSHLDGLDPETLCQVLITGLTRTSSATAGARCTSTVRSRPTSVSVP